MPSIVSMTAAAIHAIFAPLVSPVFTGDPRAPTPATSDNDTSIATTAFVKAQGYASLDSPTLTGDPKAPTPSTGDNDTSIATTAFVKAQSYAPTASPTFTGDPKAPTPSAGDNDTSIATTAFVFNTRGKYVGINAQTGTTYAPTLSDVGKLVTLNNAGAITVTMPSDATTAFAVGDQIDFVGLGAGKATFSAGGSATVYSTPTATTRTQYSAVTAIKIAANTWLIVGDLG